MSRTKSIQELENDYWTDTDFQTPLIEKCYSYRKIPVNDLSVEQIRLLLGQKIGVRFIIPEAIAFLQNNILAEGDFYPGDLLATILRLDNEDWKNNKEHRLKFEELLTEKKKEIERIGEKNLLRLITDWETK